MQLKDLVNPDPWTGLSMTNHALARAMLETGTRVITTYPGSPTPEIATALTSVPEGERNFYFEYSANEKVALEVAAGASFNGHLSCVFFKSVGLNVALLAHLASGGRIPGVDPEGVLSCLEAAVPRSSFPGNREVFLQLARGR